MLDGSCQVDGHWVETGVHMVASVCKRASILWDICSTLQHVFPRRQQHVGCCRGSAGTAWPVPRPPCAGMRARLSGTPVWLL